MNEKVREFDTGRRSIEPKYDVDLETGLIINRATGRPIPSDEPVMVFRAQDHFVPDMLARYFLALPSTTAAEREHRLAVAKRLAQICEWQAANPLRVKTPDTVVDEAWG